MSMSSEILSNLAKLIDGNIIGLARSGEEHGDGEIFGLVIKVQTLPQIGKKIHSENKILWIFSDFDGTGPGGFCIDDEKGE